MVQNRYFTDFIATAPIAWFKVNHRSLGGHRRHAKEDEDKANTTIEFMGSFEISTFEGIYFSKYNQNIDELETTCA